MSEILWIACIAIFFVLVFIGGLFNFFFSKTIIKWFKNVRVISKRNLDKSSKLSYLVKVVKKICNNYNIYQPEIGIYPSSEINAFATGRNYNSLIAFSSGIINNFNEEELKGVIAHEMSHLINQDFTLMLMVTGFFDLLFMILGSLLFLVLSDRLIDKSEDKSFGGQILDVIIFTIVYQFLSSILRMLTLLPVFWFNRKRELKADRKGAKIVGVKSMLSTLYKLLEMENKEWIVDNLDLTENDLNFKNGDKEVNDKTLEPTSITALKFNPENKKRKGDWILGLFRTHPTLKERIAKLKKLERNSSSIERFV